MERLRESGLAARLPTRRRTRYLMVLAVLALLFLAAYLVTSGLNTYDRLRDHHLQLGQQSARAAAASIATWAAATQRAVDLFAREEKALLVALARAPRDKVLRQSLQASIARQFPQAFGVALADTRGAIVFTSLPQGPGAACRKALARVAHGKAPTLSVHEEPQTHVDFFTPWFLPDNQLNGILVLSLPAQAVADQLRHFELPGHRLALQRAGAGVADAAVGAFFASRATPSDVDSAVAGTEWLVADTLPKASVVAGGKEVLVSHAGLFVAFVLFAAALIWLARCKEVRRIRTEQLLRESQSELAAALDARTRELMLANERLHQQARQCEIAARQTTKLATALALADDAVMITDPKGTIE